MKLICPRCMKSVPVPDDFSGTEVACPSCDKPFAVPARYNPAVLADPSPAASPATPPVPATTSPVPPIPPRPQEPATMSPEVPPVGPTTPAGYVPPPPPVVPPPLPVAPATQVTPTAPVPTPPLPAGYVRERTLTINAKVVAWLPAVLLTLALVLTFFPWVGSHLGGAAVDSQGPWRAMFGSINRNATLEERMAVDMRWLDRLRSDWELMLPFLMALLAATALAWADRGFRSLDPRNIPPLAKFWAWRRTAILGLAGLALVLAVAQSIHGFGMERAIEAVVRENLMKEREEAGNNKSKQLAVDAKVQRELAGYELERSLWMHLSVLSIALAVLTMALYMRLDHRGTKPPPRFVLQY